MSGTKGEAPKPLGAAPAKKVEVKNMSSVWITQTAKKLAAKMPKEQRKGFMDQFKKTMARTAADRKMKEITDALHSEFEPILEKHGIKSFAIIGKKPLSKDLLKAGFKGWFTLVSHNGDDHLEMTAIVGRVHMSLLNKR